MSEGNYYNEEHRLMFDTQDGPQDCLAMCRDEATAKDIATALNKMDDMDNWPIVGIEVVQYDELVADEMMTGAFSGEDIISMLRGNTIERNGLIYLFGDNEFWRRRAK